MRRIPAIIIPIMLCALAILASAACKEPEDPDTTRKEKTLERFAALQQTLGGELKQAIQTDGVPAAIGKCKTVSPQLAAESSDGSLRIRRISDRFRNPDHAPDPYEASVLAQWRQDLAGGERPGVLTAHTDEGFRVMKPILIQNGLCLQCHGQHSDRDPAASKEIARLYPKDKATGYKMGELRGAFSAVWKE